MHSIINEVLNDVTKYLNKLEFTIYVLISTLPLCLICNAKAYICLVIAADI